MHGGWLTRTTCAARACQPRQPCARGASVGRVHAAANEAKIDGGQKRKPSPLRIRPPDLPAVRPDSHTISRVTHQTVTPWPLGNAPRPFPNPVRAPVTRWCFLFLPLASLALPPLLQLPFATALSSPSLFSLLSSLSCRFLLYFSPFFHPPSIRLSVLYCLPSLLFAISAVSFVLSTSLSHVTYLSRCTRLRHRQSSVSSCSLLTNMQLTIHCCMCTSVTRVAGKSVFLEGSFYNKHFYREASHTLGTLPRSILLLTIPPSPPALSGARCPPRPKPLAVLLTWNFHASSSR